MLTTQITIINKLGLHARASAKFVATATKFQSNIKIIHKTQEVNGKSIMGVLLLAAGQDSKLTLQIDGIDEEEMLAALTTLINNRFGEAE